MDSGAMTLEECYKKAGGFPFLVEYTSPVPLAYPPSEDSFLIIGRASHVGWRDAGGGWWLDEPHFVLVDYFTKDFSIANASGHEYTICEQCKPYWTRCKCADDYSLTG